MRLRIGVFVGLILVQAIAGPVYHFSVIRYEKTAQLAKAYEPFLNYLSQKTGLGFEFVYTDTHEELIEKMRQGKVHMAHMGPQPYVMLKARCVDAEPIAVFLDDEGGSTYHCSLAVREESPLKSLEQVSGQRLALTQRLSTCGWLSPVSALKRAGGSMQSNRYRFAGTHVDAVMALMLQEADVAAARSDIVDRYRHMGIRHLSINGPYPNFVIVLNVERIPKAHQALIRSAVLSLKHQDAHRRESWHPYLRFGAVAADDALFDPVRAELRAIGELL
ncbi:MAG: phosphate/phosphite/phosphonate ABC transporter substrate-binding protein [Campylobacterales bacterium]